MSYLVLLQYLPESFHLGADESAQGINVVTALANLLSIFGEAPLPLVGQATVVGAL